MTNAHIQLSTEYGYAEYKCKFEPNKEPNR